MTSSTADAADAVDVPDASADVVGVPADAAVAVARQVTACPDVVRLVGHPAGYGVGGEADGTDGNRSGELASYVGGRRIAGVRVGPDAVVVGVACRYGPTMAELAAQVRAAVLIAVPSAPRVDVIIDDLEVDVPAWAGVI